MKKMILWTIVLFAPLLWTTTTHAIFGLPDFAALAQRVTIIVNQGIQIGHAVSGLNALNESFDKLKEQYDHMKESTLGQVGALTQPFADLTAIPGQIVGTGMAWRSDFTNPKSADLVTALDLFSNSGTSLTDHYRDQLADAPTVTEADVIAEYATLPVSLADRASANYRRHRDDGEQATALTYAVNGAAATASATVKSALESYQALRSQTNTSDTALRQAQVAGLITSGEVSAALLELHAWQATQQAAQDLEAETRRREREVARLAAQAAARATYARRLTGIEAKRDGGNALLFSLGQ